MAADMDLSSESASLGPDARERLRTYAARIERLEEDRANIQTDIKGVYAEAKSEGFDIKALRKAITLRRQDRQDRERDEAMLELYLDALGAL